MYSSARRARSISATLAALPGSRGRSTASWAAMRLRSRWGVPPEVSYRATQTQRPSSGSYYSSCTAQDLGRPRSSSMVKRSRRSGPIETSRRRTISPGYLGCIPFHSREALSSLLPLAGFMRETPGIPRKTMRGCPSPLPSWPPFLREA